MFDAFRNWFSPPTEIKSDQNLSDHSILNGRENEQHDDDRKMQNHNSETASPESQMTETTNEVSNLSSELTKKAQEELNEICETRSCDIETLRQMVLAENDLRCPLDDAFLLRFLRARKFNHERAFYLLRRYYQIRVKHPDLYINFRPSAIIHVIEMNLTSILPLRDQDGRRVFVFCPGIWKPSCCTEEDVFRTCQLIFEKVIEEEETQINGIVILIDMRNMSFLHVKHFTPAWAKKFASLMQDFFPVRIKGINFVFENLLLDVLLLSMKPFLSKKIRNRIFCHGRDLNSLQQIICSEILPEEYGGTQPPIDNTKFIQSLLENENEFVKNASFGYQINHQIE